MERKVLTYNEDGVIKDFIPYVDDLGIMIGGTNLRDYLAQIEENIQNAILFLGAFESEENLLAKYPNGSELKVGTYAIVSDEDALYIYDTDNLKWLKTASATIGVLQLNGLNPINGSLVITGGDIDATVSSAEEPTQKITEHLNTLYAKSKLTDTLKKGIMARAYSNNATEIGDKVTYHATVSMEFKDSLFLTTKLIHAEANNTDHYSKKTALTIDYNDGTSKTYDLADSDGRVIFYGSTVNYFGTDYDPYVTIYLLGSVAYILTFNIKENSRVTDSYYISASGWIENEEGNGYKYIIDMNEKLYGRVEYTDLLNVYKIIDGIKTKAIIDYTISSNIITILSDEIFEGGAIIFYEHK